MDIPIKIKNPANNTYPVPSPNQRIAPLILTIENGNTLIKRNSVKKLIKVIKAEKNKRLIIFLHIVFFYLNTKSKNPFPSSALFKSTSPVLSCFQCRLYDQL